MMVHNLESFELTFEPGGRLTQLTPHGCAALLAANGVAGDVGGGTMFTPCGWDECFPTIEAHGESPVMGDLVATRPELTIGECEIRQTWKTARYTAVRRFRAYAPRALESRFTVVGRMPQPLPFLWASHALFAVTGLRRVLFADGTRLDAFAVDGTSSKTFVPNTGPIRLHRADCEVVLTTDQPWWGIWHNRGGWPAARPAGFACLGLEPTTHNADAPSVRTLSPTGRFAGWIQLEVRTPQP